MTPGELSFLDGRVPSKFWDKVIPEPNSGCWLWLSPSGSYGKFVTSGKPRMAHRVTWEAANGAIPAGLVLDHLCRTPCCVNPRHLEPVTNGENVLRGVSVPAQNARATHCAHGHEFTSENTFVRGHKNRKGFERCCRTCRRLQHRRDRLRKLTNTSHIFLSREAIEEMPSEWQEKLMLLVEELRLQYERALNTYDGPIDEPWRPNLDARPAPGMGGGE